MPKVVGIFAVPGVQLLDVSAPLDVFAQANAECGKPFYTLRIIASESGPIRSSSGAQLLPDWIVPDIPERIDTLLVAGAPSAGRIALRTDVLAWLRAAAVQSKRYGSICTGAFILAATGLLKGRHLTTHWAAADALAEAYPSLAVDADALYVRDGKLRTGAGVTAELRSGARAGRGRSRPRDRAARRRTTGHVLQAPGRPTPVQPQGRGAPRRTFGTAGGPALDRGESGTRAFGGGNGEACGHERATSHACSARKSA